MRTTASNPVPLNLNLDHLAESGLIDPSWVVPLGPVQGQLDALAGFLQKEVDAGRVYLPAPDNLLRAFQLPFDQVRVVILGQDPYPTPGHPIGLAFAVSPQTRPIPRSLSNILTELSSDLGAPVNDPQVLERWSEQGVLLLNRVLSVQPGHAGSHRKRGWEAVTECALRALDARPGHPLVAVLWGNDAQIAAQFMPHARLMQSAHPSPLSARRGFFGSRPFSQVNTFLGGCESQPIDWLA